MTATSKKSAGSSRRARPAQKRRSRMVPVAAPLGDEQRRDEVARQHEEGVDAVEAAGDRGQAGVECDQGEHGDGPDAVEAPDVGHAGRPASGPRVGAALR